MGKTQVFDISLERMQKAYKQMREHAGWDLSQKMFWGYYFLDKNHNKLENFSNALKTMGFETVEIRQINGESLFLLHVEEHAAHTVESLFNQCQKLAQLANDNNIQIFDGWDVEKEELNKGLVE